MADTATGGQDGSDSGTAPAYSAPKVGPFSGLILFVRQVIAELSKVVTPTRKQLLTYFIVVLIFVIFIMAYVMGIDIALVKATNWVFTDTGE